MAAPSYRGTAVVYGASGSLTLAGVAMTTQNNTATVTNADEVFELKGSRGKVETVGNIENIKDIDLEVVVGGSSTADAASKAALVRKNDKLVTSGFAVADYNDTWRVMEHSTTITNSGALIMKLKGRKNEADFSAAATNL